MTNPDAVIKTVELKTLLKKAEIRINLELDCLFSEARQPLIWEDIYDPIV